MARRTWRRPSGAGIRRIYGQWTPGVAAWERENSAVVRAAKRLRLVEPHALTHRSTSLPGATMVALGWPGTGTGPQTDRGVARNGACRVERGERRPPPDEPPAVLGFRAVDPEALALWVCVHCSKAPQFDAWLKENMGGRGLSHDWQGRGDWKSPHHAAVERLQALLGRDGVEVVYQHDGQVVGVPPGWYHWVLNLQPCIKAAWDFTDPAELHLYIEEWADHVSGWVGEASNTDYMGALASLREAIDQEVYAFIGELAPFLGI